MFTYLLIYLLFLACYALNILGSRCSVVLQSLSPADCAFIFRLMLTFTLPRICGRSIAINVSVCLSVRLCVG